MKKLGKDQRNQKNEVKILPVSCNHEMHSSSLQPRDARVEQHRGRRKSGQSSRVPERTAGSRPSFHPPSASTANTQSPCSSKSKRPGQSRTEIYWISIGPPK